MKTCAWFYTESYAHIENIVRPCNPTLESAKLHERAKAATEGAKQVIQWCRKNKRLALVGPKRSLVCLLVVC